jgi:hypothetical protein
VCFACSWVGRRLGLPLVPVFPVRLCPLPSPLYAVLMGYKESPVLEARRRFASIVCQLLDGFLAVHAACLDAAAGGPAEIVLPVPSTTRPLGAALGRVEGLAAAVRTRIAGARWSPDLLVRAGTPVGHMRPDAGAFVVPMAGRGGVTGRRALLLDDTYVSGARAQSAACALRRAGARSVLIVALGRVLRPDRSPGHAAFLCQYRMLPPVAGGPTPMGPCRRCVQIGVPTE